MKHRSNTQAGEQLRASSAKASNGQKWTATPAYPHNNEVHEQRSTRTNEDKNKHASAERRENTDLASHYGEHWGRALVARWRRHQSASCAKRPRQVHAPAEGAREFQTGFACSRFGSGGACFARASGKASAARGSRRKSRPRRRAARRPSVRRAPQKPGRLRRPGAERGSSACRCVKWGNVLGDRQKQVRKISPGKSGPESDGGGGEPPQVWPGLA